jgi:uncharacterized protein DUF4012
MKPYEAETAEEHLRTIDIQPRVQTGSPSPRLVRHVRRKRRRRGLIAAAVVLAILAGSAGGAYYAYVSVKRQATQLEAALVSHLESGQHDLQIGEADLKQATNTRDEKLIADAKVRFASAKAQFEAARTEADSSNLLRQLERVPGVGTSVAARHSTVDGASEMGVHLSLAGTTLADLDDVLVRPSGAGQQRNLLTMITDVQGKIGPVRKELQSALAASADVDVAVLPTSQQVTFQHAIGTISKALSALDQFQSLIPIITEVLGGNGVRNYLIEQVNPAELRPGGGFIGTYSILRAEHGSLSLVKSGNAYELSDPRAAVGQKGYVAPPSPFIQFIPNTSWSFVDSNFFPEFASNAQAADSFVEPRLGFHIDAVVAIDYYTVAKILELTGAIPVPGYPITLTSDNFVSTVAQYDIRQLQDPNAALIHKAIVSATAGPLLQRIVGLQPSQWPTLIAAFNDMSASRHLQSYFDNQDVEKAMTQYGWSGALNTTRTSDYMMEVEANLGGTKANYFVTRHYTVDLTRIGPVIHHKVSVDITDSMPYSYVPNEYYQAYIRMLTAGNADSMSDDLSHPQHQTTAPPGTKVLDGWIRIHGYGHDRVVTFNWNTPWQPNGRGVEQIYWQKEPGTQADKVDVTWNDGNGHIYKVSGDLAQDRVITLAPNGVSLVQGQVGTAQLPSLSLG